MISRSLFGSLGSQHVKIGNAGPGWVAQLVKASCLYVKVAGLILCQSTYKNEPMSA